MELGLFFALLTAVSFAFSNAFVRRGTHHAGESYTAVVITIIVGLVIFLVALLINGEWRTYLTLDWSVFAVLALAGVIHFVAGRFLSYSAIRLIGANRSSAIIRTQLIYPLVLGVTLLSEPFGIFLLLGALCIAAGATLVTGDKIGGAADKSGNVKGVLAAFAGAFCWGISGVLIKPMVSVVGSSLAAVFISYTAAFLVMIVITMGKKQRGQVAALTRHSVTPLVISGLFLAGAQVSRFTALMYSPVSAVEPLIATNVLFILLLSYIMNRKIEVFNWRIYTGMGLTIVGAVFLFL